MTQYSTVLKYDSIFFLFLRKARAENLLSSDMFISICLYRYTKVLAIESTTESFFPSFLLSLRHVNGQKMSFYGIH
jgi:hypothetical protein